MQAGQSMLEICLILPFVLLLLVGVIEIGRYAYISILVGNAARAGAAYGSLNLAHSVDTTGISTAAINDFQNNGQAAPSGFVNSSISCGCDSGGSVSAAGCSPSSNPNAGFCSAGHWVVVVSVTAAGSFNGLLRYPGIPTPLAVTGTSQMRVAQR